MVLAPALHHISSAVSSQQIGPALPDFNGLRCHPLLVSMSPTGTAHPAGWLHIPKLAPACQHNSIMPNPAR